MFPVCPPFRLRVSPHRGHTYLSWTIPGLPGSHICLPHRVARTHLGTMRWTPHAFASRVQARPFPIFGRPVHPGDVSPRFRPGGSPQALRTPPHGERPALRSPAGGGSRSPLAVSGFRPCARVGFSIPASRRPVRHDPPPLDSNLGSQVEWDFNPPDTCAARHTR
jgi:hypothetical protein